MIEMKITSIAILALTISLAVPSANASETEALLKAGGNRGGICLIIGAKDPALAGELAGKSALYVQLLQSDAKTAAAWGAKIASAPYRENIGVRNADFDAAHYSSDIFNLIVVLGGKAKLPDLYRILVPGGVVAFKSAPGSLAAEAGIEVGDLIVAIDGEPVKGAWEIRSALSEVDGRNVRVDVIRDGSSRSFDIEFPQRDEDGDDRRRSRGPRA